MVDLKKGLRAAISGAVTGVGFLLLGRSRSKSANIECYTLERDSGASSLYCTELRGIANNGDGTAVVFIVLYDREGDGAIASPSIGVSVNGVSQYEASYSYLGQTLSVEVPAQTGDTVTVTSTTTEFNGGEATLTAKVPKTAPSP